MQSETIVQQDPENHSPSHSQSSSEANVTTNGRRASNAKPNASQTAAASSQFPPPKTDKPRPHTCGTCGRAFARLEHLKRHERSHTKEKPFECPECTRCFARRDLLLRHQQKLHMTNTTSSRPRAGRRESVSGTSVSGGNRVRKNSVANVSVASLAGIGPPTARPRANTISHIDLSSLGLHDGTGANFNRMNALGLGLGHAHTASLSGMGTPMMYDRGMNGHGFPHGLPHGLPHGFSHGLPHGLPKLDTHSINNMTIPDALHTAPPMAGFGGFDLDQLFSPGTTVNPAQLHMGGAVSTPGSMAPQMSPFVNPQPAIAEDDDYGWMRNWSMHNAGFDGNEIAIEESSPSRISSGDSPGDFGDNMVGSAVCIPLQHSVSWPQDLPVHTPLSAGPFQLDALGTGLPSLDAAMLSSPGMQDPTPTGENYFHQAMMQQNFQQMQQQQQQLQQQQQQHQHQQRLQQSPSDMMHGSQINGFASSLSNFDSDSPSMSSSSITGSARQSSVTSASTDSITDATRQALLASLSQPSVFGLNHRKYSQPSVSSPLSPGAARNSVQGPSLPSTAEIRKYVDAFIQFAQPHMPVLHIPTLTFDSIDYCSSIRGNNGHVPLSQNSIIGGGGCLILAMAAIGALYEYDHPASKDLFEAAKKMIGLYLEERRKADMSAAVNGGANNEAASQHTPLWLVQAMLLNVIYGHQCGDKTAADIASNHCAALVSLARAAELCQPPAANSPSNSGSVDHDSNDMHMVDAGASSNGQHLDLQTQWLNWKIQEERKRTLFAVFIISSLLTTAYNNAPTIMNSEILLDLPCDEHIWAAENAQAWQNMGGLAAAEQNAVSFADALSTLLTANKRQAGGQSGSAYNSNNPLGALQAGDTFGNNDLRPSTFGCLVLINALHNYIWETRSRHHGRQWTQQESESMFSHIEPALNAWQAAWKANEHHKLERPNPFGLGPLSADSIPLLDLAFVRLFVNLGRSKEAFWQRDFDAMADELARGSEIVQHADGSLANQNGTAASPGNKKLDRRASQVSEQASCRRERHLRKAAFYAADSLTIACSFNLTYTDTTAHELPIQSAMCFFDCGQVLAEWASTVQERVGRYLGVLGRDQIDYTQVPAIMLLETEDVELLRKIESICESMEQKRFQQENLVAMDLQHLNQAATMSAMHNNVNLNACGYGSKTLRIVAMMLERCVVWPVTHVMAKALETQATHMDQRAEASTVQ